MHTIEQSKEEKEDVLLSAVTSESARPPHRQKKEFRTGWTILSLEEVVHSKLSVNCDHLIHLIRILSKWRHVSIRFLSRTADCTVSLMLWRRSWFILLLSDNDESDRSIDPPTSFFLFPNTVGSNVECTVSLILCGGGSDSFLPLSDHDASCFDPSTDRPWLLWFPKHWMNFCLHVIVLSVLFGAPWVVSTS